MLRLAIAAFVSHPEGECSLECDLSESDDGWSCHIHASGGVAYEATPEHAAALAALVRPATDALGRHDRYDPRHPARATG